MTSRLDNIETCLPQSLKRNPNIELECFSIDKSFSKTKRKKDVENKYEYVKSLYI